MDSFAAFSSGLPDPISYYGARSWQYFSATGIKPNTIYDQNETVFKFEKIFKKRN